MFCLIFLSGDVSRGVTGEIYTVDGYRTPLGKCARTVLVCLFSGDDHWIRELYFIAIGLALSIGDISVEMFFPCDLRNLAFRAFWHPLALPVCYWHQAPAKNIQVLSKNT